MAKRKKKQPQPEPAPAKDKPPAPTVKKPLPPDAVKRMAKFYQDNREQERFIWKSIYG